MNRILVVEDDHILNNTLRYSLESSGYHITAVFTAAGARAAWQASVFDIAVLDVNLPDGNGWDLCRELTAERDTPVVFLTANDMESDMIRGYELGAADYITKPFHMSVFQRKLAALLQLASGRAKDCYESGPLCINFSSYTVKLAGHPVVFTPMEYRALKVFTANPRVLLTRNALLEKLWDCEGKFVDEHTLTTIISRLRGKLEHSGKQYIKTVYGMGYMWVGETDE